MTARQQLARLLPLALLVILVAAGLRGEVLAPRLAAARPNGIVAAPIGKAERGEIARQARQMVAVKAQHRVGAAFFKTVDQDTKHRVRLREAIEIARHFRTPALPRPVIAHGDGEEDRKSVSFRLTLGSPERTLSSEEVGEIRGRIIEGMRERGYELRV